MKIKILLFLLVSMMTNVSAQDFDTYFEDATLRLDYIFAGDADHQEIYLDKLNRIERWHGKHKRLAEVPVRGNGQLLMHDHKTGTLIYRNSFSTLFQEWLSYDEAQTSRRSFENVFLAPMPKDTADVTIVLYDNRQEACAVMSHQVVPTDILIRRINSHKTTPYETLVPAADADNCINVAFVAEGYTDEEMDVFLDDCHTACDALFAHEPFRSLKSRFNIIAVKSASAESGTSEPRKGIWRNTVLGSHFDTFYSDRYLTTLNLKDLHDVLAGTPYEHIIVLVNTGNYGGGGILNSYNLSMTHHPKFRSVVVHEFGHSFAGLADEYAYEAEQIPMYPHDVEPWEPNITTKADFASKWKDMMGQNGVDLYEGAGYSPKGVYRPCEDCRMRTNENPEFCPVCQKAIRDLIDFYTK